MLNVWSLFLKDLRPSTDEEVENHESKDDACDDVLRGAEPVVLLEDWAEHWAKGLTQALRCDEKPGDAIVELVHVHAWVPFLCRFDHFREDWYNYHTTSHTHNA